MTKTKFDQKFLDNLNKQYEKAKLGPVDKDKNLTRDAQISFMCGECGKIDSKRFVSIANTGPYCVPCSKKKGYIKQEETKYNMKNTDETEVKKESEETSTTGTKTTFDQKLLDSLNKQYKKAKLKPIFDKINSLTRDTKLKFHCDECGTVTNKKFR